MKPLINISLYLFIGTLLATTSVGFGATMNDSKEIKLTVALPKENSPMQLRVVPLVKNNGEIQLNQNAFLQGFLVSICVKFKDDSSHFKMLSPGNTAFMNMELKTYKLDNEIPIPYVTAYIFNALYQNIAELRISESIDVSIKIYFCNLTENAKTGKIIYQTNSLSFSKEEIFKLIALYKSEPDAFNFIQPSINKRGKLL